MLVILHPCLPPPPPPSSSSFLVFSASLLGMYLFALRLYPLLQPEAQLGRGRGFTPTFGFCPSSSSSLGEAQLSWAPVPHPLRLPHSSSPHQGALFLLLDPWGLRMPTPPHDCYFWVRRPSQMMCLTPQPLISPYRQLSPESHRNMPSLSRWAPD